MGPAFAIISPQGELMPGLGTLSQRISWFAFMGTPNHWFHLPFLYILMMFVDTRGAENGEGGPLHEA